MPRAVTIDATASVAIEPRPLETMLADVVPRPGRMDLLCLAGVAIARSLLTGGPLATRHALVLGTCLGCVESDHAYYRQVLDAGVRRANPRLFAYTLPNVVLGEVAIAFGLSGEQLVLSAGRASGVMAVVEAWHLLSAGLADQALVFALDPGGDGTTALLDAAGCRLQPVATGLRLGVGGDGPRILRATAGFEPGAAGRDSVTRPLGASGISTLLAMIRARDAGSVTARCSSGHRASLELGG